MALQLQEKTFEYNGEKGASLTTFKANVKATLAEVAEWIVSHMGLEVYKKTDFEYKLYKYKVPASNANCITVSVPEPSSVSSGVSIMVQGQNIGTLWADAKTTITIGYQGNKFITGGIGTSQFAVYDYGTKYNGYSAGSKQKFDTNFKYDAFALGGADAITMTPVLIKLPSGEYAIADDLYVCSLKLMVGSSYNINGSTWVCVGGLNSTGVGSFLYRI